MTRKATNAQFWATKALSREKIDSRAPSRRSWRRRQMSRPVQATNTRAMYQRKNTPMPDLANACTLEMRPERVRKVPKIVRTNVVNTSTMFQIFRSPRRSWMPIECR